MDWFKIIPMSISAIAACISVFYAVRVQRLQTRMAENKADIQKISELIEILKVSKAISEYPFDFSDEDFTLGDDLNEVPSKIAILVQNTNIASQINKIEWDLPISDFEQKIIILNNIRKSLF